MHGHTHTYVPFKTILQRNTRIRLFKQSDIDIDIQTKAVRPYVEEGEVGGELQERRVGLLGQQLREVAVVVSS